MRLAALVLALALAASACAPRLAPPYRDYEARTSEAGAPLRDRLADAAREAGWTVEPSPDPAVVSTAPRRVGTGLWSTTDAALDLVPLDGGYVRVYVRAERRSFLGGRSKVYALSPSLRASIFGSISDALAGRGLVALGTPRDRDEDATD